MIPIDHRLRIKKKEEKVQTYYDGELAPVYLYSDSNNRDEFIEDENDATDGGMGYFTTSFPTDGGISGGMNNGLPPPREEEEKW